MIDFSKRKFLIGWYLAAMVILFGGIAIAMQHFPGDFDWQYRVVSDLASQLRNPEGNRYFCVALGICCVMLFPVAAFLRKHLSLSHPRISAFSQRALQAGFIASIAIGVERLTIRNLSDYFWKAHEYIAIVAFAGLFLGVVGFWFALAHAYVRDRGLPLAAGVGLIFASAAPMVGVALSQAYLYFVPNSLGWVGPHWRALGIPIYLSFAFWEWIASVSVFVYLFLLVCFAPPLTNSKTVRTTHLKAS